jgi:hypothetical protein
MIEPIKTNHRKTLPTKRLHCQGNMKIRGAH